jgi:hypothetical protein
VPRFLLGDNAGDGSGYSVSNAGDVNGDGLDDLIVGARNADPSGTVDAGKSYVVFGWFYRRQHKICLCLIYHLNQLYEHQQSNHSSHRH